MFAEFGTKGTRRRTGKIQALCRHGMKPNARLNHQELFRVVNIQFDGQCVIGVLTATGRIVDIHHFCSEKVRL